MRSLQTGTDDERDVATDGGRPVSQAENSTRNVGGSGSESGLLGRLRDRWRRWKVNRQRRKLLTAYAKVGRVRYDLGPGISPMLFAYDRVTSEGLAVIVEEDGERKFVWLWPEDERDVATDGGRPHRVCRSVPAIDPDEIEDLSIGHVPGDGPYSPGIGFRAAGRKFELLDRDEDGVVDFAFSYGGGPEWCVDHDALPEAVIEYVEEWLHPLDMDIPDEFRAPGAGSEEIATDGGTGRGDRGV